MLNPPDVPSDLLKEFRQFSRYIASSWSSPTHSVAHLNGIFVEYTNQSNLNRFLRNVPALGILPKSCDLINRYSSDPEMVIDDTIIQRKGKHMEGSGWVFDHSEGKSELGMQYITAVVSGKERIFPLNLDLKTKSGISKIVMQMAVIRRSIKVSLYFSTVVFDS